MLKATFSKSSTCDFSCLCLCEFGLFWFLGLISVESFTDLINLGLAIYAINLSKLGQKVYEGQGKDKIKKKEKKEQRTRTRSRKLWLLLCSLHLST